MGKFGCQVFSFDPSIGMEDHQHAPNVQFFNLGLADIDREGNPLAGGRGKWKLKTLDSIIKQLNHSEVRLRVKHKKN